MTRREFLRWAFWTGAAGLAYSYGLLATELTRGGRSIGRTTGAPRIAIPTICRLCPACCGILAFLEDGVLVKIEGNPKDPNARGGICPKGLAAVQLFVQPDRVLRPLRRVGPRGSGRWEPVAWDEALSELASRLAEIRTGNPEGFVFLGGPQGQGIEPLIRRFLSAFGGPTVAEVRTLWLANRAEALRLTWGEDSYIPDLARTKYILNFGANPYETGEMYVPLVRRLIEGRRSGAKLVTFDPRLSRTAGKSDEWFPIKPGTDAAVALAMANVIVQLGLYDREFFEKYSNWRLERLAEHLRPYTPEWAEGISGVKAAHIRRIAVEFATNHPALVLTGGGLSQHESGVQNERAVFLLVALTGNLERRGGLCLPRRYELSDPEPKPAGKPRSVAPQELFAQLAEGELQPQLLWIDRANPAFDHPEPQVVQTILRDEKKVPFVVVSDAFRSETAELADLILPAATFLESWDLHSPPAYDLVPYVALQQPVLLPLGEARPAAEVFLELAKQLGGDLKRFFPFGSVRDFVKQQAESLPELARAGGLEYLIEHGIWIPAAHPEYQQEFPTPSKRLEVYSSTLADRKQPALPTYIAVPEHQKLEDGEFQLVVFESAVQDNGITALLWWLLEIEHRNPLWINTEVARQMGIRKGDPVRVISKAGEIQATAFPTQGIHPRVVAIHAGLGHWGLGRITRGGAFRSLDPNTQLIWWKGSGVHVQPVIPRNADPVGRGQAWQGTVVRLVRAGAATEEVSHEED
jgi:anaerobic selenocysteine-containing dehydrogenase